MEVMAIVGGHKRDAGFFGEADQVFIDALLDFQSLVLNFEEEVSLSEDFAQLVGIFAGQVEFFVHHGFGDRPAQAGGKSDQAFAVPRE